MGVFADPHTHDVDCGLPQEPAVPGTFRFQIGGVAVNIVDRLKGPLAKKPVPEKIPKALGGVPVKADIFIHVKNSYPGTVKAVIRHEGREKFFLRRGGGKNYPDGGLYRQ
jgi:hypothetical protein